MLIEVSVGNYKSFKDVVTFSMVAAKITSKDKTLDVNNVQCVDEDLCLLKGAAIYGANGSGKSNFASAVLFMRDFVFNSSKSTQEAEPIGVEAFKLSVETEKQPSFFEVVFLIDGTKYRYGFEVDAERVVKEWLFNTPSRKEAKLFIRDKGGIEVMPRFKEGRDLIDKTRDNALFLSVVAQFNGAISKQVVNWFRRLSVISGLQDRTYRSYTEKTFADESHRDSILQFMKRLDLGISDIQVQDTSSAPKQVVTIHRKYDATGSPTSVEVFDIDSHESEGTKKLFALAGPLMETLKSGRILVVDELDARLHPLITLAVINLFHSPEANRKGAQLIFITHDTNLLSNKIFRRDQIWFAEKDKQGATHMHSLVEYRVRNDASFESDYIQGKYGAIPFLGDLRRLAGNGDA
jgi:AAA15 family ATPase/GTPase